MADDATQDEALDLFDLDLPLRSLAALAGVPDLMAGALSPLLRVPRPAGMADVAGMRQLLEDAQGLSPWVMPTLLDPHFTATFIVGDEDAPVLSQYAWPDAAAAGPGCEMIIGDDRLRVSGPVDLPDLRQQFAALLRLDDLPDLPVVTMTLEAADLWVLAALADAYRMTLTARRATRQGGLPGGVYVQDILAAWELGLQTRNAGWAVTMLSLLAPDLVPGDFAETLRQTLESMDDADLVIMIDADEATGEGELVIFGPGLELLVSGLSGPLHLFGACTQRLADAESIEVTLLAGWRLPAAVWLVDLSALREGRAELVLASGEYMTDMINGLLAGEPTAEFRLDTPYTAEALWGKLSAIPDAPAHPQARFCRRCGAALDPNWKFCAKCNTAVARGDVE